VILAVIVSGCGGGSDDLVGEWSQISGSRTQSILVFNADGTGNFHPRGGMNYEIVSWSMQTDYIEMELAGTKVIAEVSVDDSLVLSRANEFEELNGTYRRK
jgi:hypothetical protein